MKIQRNPLTNIYVKNIPWFHSSLNTRHPVPILDFYNSEVFDHPVLGAAPNLQPQQKALLLKKDANTHYSIYVEKLKKKKFNPLDEGIFNVLKNYFRIDEIISMHGFLEDFDFERLKELTNEFASPYRHSFLKALNYRLIKHRIIEESNFIVPPVSMKGAMEALNFLSLRVPEISKKKVEEALKERGIVSCDPDFRRWVYWNGFGYEVIGRPTKGTLNRKSPKFVFRPVDTLTSLNVKKRKQVGEIAIPNSESGISQEILKDNGGSVVVPLWRIQDLIDHYIIEGNSQRQDKAIHRIYFAGGFLPDYNWIKSIISYVFPNDHRFKPGAGLVWANQVKNKQ